MLPSEPGYFIRAEVVTLTECDRLIADLESASLPRSRAGTRHLMSHPAVQSLAWDLRLLNLARSALGEHAVPFRATLFDKSPATNWLIPWHQDTALPLAARFDLPNWGPWSRKAAVDYAHAPASALSRVIALRFHLDDSTAENGPLRVIPDSHKSGVLTDTQIAAAVRAGEPVECVVPRGGVIGMRPLLIHSSSKVVADRPRRVLHIEYAETLELAPDVRLAIA